MPFYQDNERLFCTYDLSAGLRKNVETISNSVDQIPRDQFLSTPVDDLVEHDLAEHTVDYLVLYEDQISATHGETTVDVSRDTDRYWSDDGGGPRLVPGTNVTVSIPYSGDPSLWHIKPSHSRLHFPLASVAQPGSDGIGHIKIVINLPTDVDPTRYKQLLDEQLDGIRFFVNSQKDEIERHNAELPQLIQRAIEARQNRLKKEEDIVAVLDIPVRPRNGSPDFKPIVLEKKKVVKPLPPPPRSGFEPEPGITPELYEQILDIVRHAGRSFEQTPDSIADLGEEALRGLMLGNLNTHFQGDATGETFRKRGKTDIRIEDKDRAAFIAECKIWDGPSSVGGAVDQLLGYLTWRDCKAAMIFFNKTVAGFTELQKKYPAQFRAHPNFKRELETGQDGEWRFVLSSKDDDLREITIQAFLFDLHV